MVTFLILSIFILSWPRKIDRLLGFTNDTTRMLHDSAMLGPSHPDTNARLSIYLSIYLSWPRLILS